MASNVFAHRFLLLHIFTFEIQIFLDDFNLFGIILPDIVYECFNMCAP